ncbi:uncharacterized protein [Apostichopus japonicus]|uniref:uncharacterized protein isoform X2 n=1 Tax=Stichopus japonicus TaxID=307972 RepID=UPI003AB4DAAD
MASFLICVSSLFLLISALIQVTLNLIVVTPERVAAPLGRSAIIPCTTDQTDEPYEVIYWSRGHHPEESEQIVFKRKDTPPGGIGMTSGHFNITEDGGLVINYMRIEFEGSYVCQVLDAAFDDDFSTTELIATVKPEVGPSIGLECQDDLCSPQLELGDVVNLTCTSGEARPAIELIWTNDHGTPLTPIYEDLGEGSLTGTFVTVSTIQYTFKRATILTCQADGESIGKGSAEQRKTIALTLSTTAAPDVKPEVDPSGKPTNEKALLGKPNSGKGKSKGLDLVIILVVVVAVSIGVVFILVIAVAVLYKKNKEYSFFPRSGKSYHRAEPEDYIRGYNDTVSNKL